MNHPVSEHDTEADDPERDSGDADDERHRYANVQALAGHPKAPGARPRSGDTPRETHGAASIKVRTSPQIGRN
jgi:hypothetical protein